MTAGPTLGRIVAVEIHSSVLHAQLVIRARGADVHLLEESAVVLSNDCEDERSNIRVRRRPLLDDPHLYHLTPVVILGP